VQSGQTSERYRLERALIAAMGGLLFPIAAQLVTTGLPCLDAVTAAPPRA
jgi:hypothetical protein